MCVFNNLYRYLVYQFGANGKKANNSATETIAPIMISQSQEPKNPIGTLCIRDVVLVFVC